MRRWTGTMIALALGLLIMASPVRADFDQYREWLVCGGNHFDTCAAVQVGIMPTDDSDVSNVTMRLWNLSGQEGTYASTVFTKVGFFNIGGDAEAVGGSLTMDGQVRDGDAPDDWVLGDNNDAGGVSLEMVTSANDGNSSVDNSLASACGNELPDGDNDLWQNPCLEDLSDLPDAGDDVASAVAAGWAVVNFDITGSWDLAASDMLIMGQNGPEGYNEDGEWEEDLSTQCITGDNCHPVSEPLTIALLGAGLVGLAGAGIVGRRRDEELLEEEESSEG